MASTSNLKSGVLSPLESLGQSIANVAPTATPAMIIGQVFVLSGNGTWLAYLIATCGVALVAANINQFARTCASPGSLYSYTARVLPSFWSTAGAWSLVIAYVCTAVALTGGLTSYANIFLQTLGWPAVHPAILTVLAIATAGALAYRDVTLSARLMLTLEGVSIAIILVIVGFTLYRHGSLIDPEQLKLRGVTGNNLQLGLVLAIFSFVGFESATALGAEARNPFRSVPRAVMLSAVFAGVFFTVCSYTEVLGFRGAAQPLGQSLAPLNFLALKAGLPTLGLLIDISAVVSFFSCSLACITAAARVLFDMGRQGDAHPTFGDAHASNQTPHRAVLFAAVFAIVPGVILAFRGVPGFDINGWMGTLATFGFLVAYILVCVSAPFYLRARGELTVPAIAISVIAVAFMFVAFAGSVYPVPPSPNSWFPYIFLLLLGMGIASSLTLRSRKVIYEETSTGTAQPGRNPAVG
jgi:amino acid transporter